MSDRTALEAHYLSRLLDNTQSEQKKLEDFIEAYIAGNDTLSALQKAASISKPTAIKWRNHVRDVDSDYSYLLEASASLTSLEAGTAPLGAILDPTSREFVLESLGWGLVKARENGNPDQISRLAKQVAEVQGYKAKEMGREYDITQRLGEEGIEAVDKETALCVLALAEHPTHYPQACRAILQAAGSLSDIDLSNVNLPPVAAPEGANSGRDTHSQTPYTDYLAEAHAAPDKSKTPSISPQTSEEEDGFSETVDEILNLDDVLEDLT